MTSWVPACGYHAQERRRRWPDSNSRRCTMFYTNQDFEGFCPSTLCLEAPTTTCGGVCWWCNFLRSFAPASELTSSSLVSLFGIELQKPGGFAYKTSQFSLPSHLQTGRVIRIKKHLMLPCQAMERSRHYRKARLLVGKQPGKKTSPLKKRRPGGIFCSWIFMVGTNTYIYIYTYMLIWNRIKCDLEAQGKFPNLGVVLLQVDEHAKGWMFTDGINPLLFDVFN